MPLVLLPWILIQEHPPGTLKFRFLDLELIKITKMLKGKEGQIYGDKVRFDFRWETHMQYTDDVS